MEKYIFGMDIGGTTIKLGLFRPEGELLEKWEIPTQTVEGGAYVLPDAVESIREATKRYGISESQVEGIGIGVPGPVDESSTVHGCVNLGWGEFNIRERMKELLPEIPNISAGNDAAVATLGELWFGGGRGYGSAAMFTLGTSGGDSLLLQYYFADYGYPLCEVASGNGGLMIEALDEDGNVLDIFQESEYEIIGIYSYPVTFTSDPYAFVDNQIFVPENSISVDFADHILEHGPMQAYNTSFRIKNSSAAGMNLDRAVEEAVESGGDAFSTAYTKGLLEESTAEEISLESASGNMWTKACMVVVCETGLVCILALFFIQRNLRAAPIYVLSAKEEEYFL